MGSADFSYFVLHVYAPPGSAGDVMPPPMEELVPVDAPIVVCGDINGHDPSWSSATPNRRGKLWRDYLQGMQICNDPGSPTRKLGSPDVVASRGVLVKNWRTLPAIADHSPLLFDVGPIPDVSPDGDGLASQSLSHGADKGAAAEDSGKESVSSGRKRKKRRKTGAPPSGGQETALTGWNWRKANWGRFRAAFERYFEVAAVILTAYFVLPAAMPPTSCTPCPGTQLPPVSHRALPPWARDRLPTDPRAPGSDGGTHLPSTPVDVSESLFREALEYASRQAIPRVRIRKRVPILEYRLATRNAGLLAAAQLSGDANARRVSEAEHIQRRAQMIEKRVRSTDFVKGGLSKAWELVREVAGHKTEAPISCLVQDGKLIAGEQALAGKFAEFYTRHGPTPGAAVAHAEYLEARAELELKVAASPPAEIEVTIGAVQRAIGRSKGGSAHGTDARLLAQIGPTGRAWMADIVQRSVSTASPAASWKLGHVGPERKPGTAGTHAKQYRPLTTVSGLSKAAESIVAEAVIEALGPGPECEIGFKKDRSPADALGIATNDLAGQPFAISLSFDISEAFNTLSRTHFLRDAARMGLRDIRNPAAIQRLLQGLRWIEALLDGRKIQVRVGSARSRWCEERAGVPQGTVVGPTCWRVGFRDLHQCLEARFPWARFIVFADDLFVYASAASGKSLQELRDGMQDIADAVVQWCSERNLQLSTTKTRAIVFRSAPTEAAWDRRHPGDAVFRSSGGLRPLQIYGEEIAFSDTAKWLGITMDARLDKLFDSHFRMLLSSLDRRLAAIRSLARKSWGVPTRALLLFYNGLITSKAQYCAGIIGPHLPRWALQAFDRHLYDAARVILSLPGKVSRLGTLAECGLLPAQHFFSVQNALFYVHAKAAGGILEQAADRPGSPWGTTGRALWEEVAGGLLRIAPKSFGRIDHSTDIWRLIDAGCIRISLDMDSEKVVREAHENGAVSYSDASVRAVRGTFGWTRYPRGTPPPLTVQVGEAWGGGTCDAPADPMLAEQEGIAAALEAERHRAEPFFSLLTDSMSSLSSLAAVGIRDPREEQICRTLVQLAREGSRLALAWVRGHANFWGNETADRIASHVDTQAPSAPLPDYLAKTWCATYVKGSFAADVVAARGCEASGAERSPLLRKQQESGWISRDAEAVFHRARIRARERTGVATTLASVVRRSPPAAVAKFEAALASGHLKRAAARRSHPRPPNPESQRTLADFPTECVEFFQDVAAWRFVFWDAEPPGGGLLAVAV